ncbi:Predicted DNA-binding protein, contains Ribbon-helix-helix (RHH) domain [Monaibacterium marinum]|uniref:Predicted DNA-binding protein, contains Ribbon-helix-helix (RHH) domain n=1 Tax=Pontivivens marinum TaxID=1690039 RepID=A0A2C9CV86_9RHOB|nr:ribbon-helix-helix domain-containing protein [Monaibacterium marinum]SOH95120.1 Predicted DNA-binding protein, contains Ribbon-helix-helix (RHH) domain [Monaibacterium marinum]
MSRPEKHSVTLRGHRTSISLEPEFWVAFRQIARTRNLSTNALVSIVDEGRSPDTGLASAIRVYVLNAALRGDETLS